MENNILMTLNFTCPKCNQLIDFKELNNNTQEHLIEFRNELESKLKDSIIKEQEEILKKRMENEFQEKLKNNKLEFEIKKQEEIDKKISEFNSKIEDINKKVLDKELEIQKLTSTLQEVNNNKTVEIESSISKKEIELNNKFNLKIEDINKTILAKELELSKTINLLSQKNSEIETLKNNFKLEMESSILKQAEISKNSYEKIIEELNKQITDLKVANAVNKTIGSKIKGMNFEKIIREALGRATAISDDIINEVGGTGQKADIRQEVVVNGVQIGKILYELKDTEKWDSKWIAKFSNDISNENANYGILVSNNVSNQFNVAFKQDVNNNKMFYAEPEAVEMVMTMVRKLILIENQCSSSNNVNEKLQEFKVFVENDLSIFITSFNSIMTNNEAREKTIINKISEMTKDRDKLTKELNNRIVEQISKFN